MSLSFHFRSGKEENVLKMDMDLQTIMDHQREGARLKKERTDQAKKTKDPIDARIQVLNNSGDLLSMFLRQL